MSYAYVWEFVVKPETRAEFDSQIDSQARVLGWIRTDKLGQKMSRLNMG